MPFRSPPSIALVLGAVLLAGCDSEAAPPPRTLATYERVLDDDSIGITRTPPIRRAPPEFDDADADAVRLFHDVLAPYGAWTDDSRLGLVWIPSRDLLGEDFARSFVPYATHGHWTYREVAADGR